MKKRFPAAAIITAAGLVFLFPGCEKTQKENGAPVNQETSAFPVPSTNDMPRTTLPPPQERKRPENVIDLAPSPGAVRNPPDARLLTNETGLFAFFPQQRLMPLDFKIGPLQDRVQAPLDLFKAGKTANQFLAGIVSRKPDFSLVLGENRNHLQDVVSYPLSRGYLPEKYRIGKLGFEGEDEIRGNIRLFKGTAVTEGEIYLTKTDEGWLVTDLQVGFTLLSREYKKDNKPFMPGTFTFLLDN